MIAIDLASQVLAEALRYGADLAEIYIKDRQSLNLELLASLAHLRSASTA